jgi:proteasome assembly chaperone (PAC2) family protein
MGVKLHKEPELKNPILIACWPGIGNIGLLAVDTLRRMLEAEEFGEIEPWDFFYPRKLVIRHGELKEMEFPSNKFFFKQTEKRDLLFFLADEQPALEGKVYAEGTKAYRMAHLVLDVASQFGCRRVYTSGAAVSSIHHSTRSRVWVVPNMVRLITEFKDYENTVFMSDIEGRGGEGNITGLNGLLLGTALKRNIEAVCIMGEIPVYLQGFPLLYPKASKSVLEVLSLALGINIDMSDISDFAQRSELEIDKLYNELPADAREQLDKLKHINHTKPSHIKAITEEDKKKILEDVDKFFKKSTKEGGN